jgi:molecular chaperone GrpE
MKEATEALLNINDSTVDLHGDEDQDTAGLLDAMEQEIRQLMHDLAEEKFHSSETRKKHEKNMKKHFISLLEVMDAFESLFAVIKRKEDQINDQMKKWVHNFQTIYRIVNGILKRHDIIPIESLNVQFDPKWHDPVDTREDPEKEDGTIVDVFKKGYMIKNEVLRRPQVIIVRND